MAIFVYAFTASGKSTLARKYKNVIDMESTTFKYLGGKEDEASKGSDDRILNPAWPNNYFEALDKVKNSNEYDYVLISDNICDSWLRENKVEYWQVYPNESLLSEYEARVRGRGNSEKFACYLRQVFCSWVEGCRNDKFASRHIELKSGEFLEDVLEGLIKK